MVFKHQVSHLMISKFKKIDFDVLSKKIANLNETGLDYLIVPNIVHLVKFDESFFDFISYITIKSIIVNHKPEVILIHTNLRSFQGQYWNWLKNESSCIKLIFISKPRYIFGQRILHNFHAADVTRLLVLMKYGGIYFDLDVFVIKSMHHFRKYELSIGWSEGQFLGNQVIVAHPNARFLKLWYNSYKTYYPTKWYYNAGELPTRHILNSNPGLVHRVKNEFGVTNLAVMLYQKLIPDEVWQQDFYCVHLLIRHRDYLVPFDSVKIFDEDNIRGYNKTFGAMVRWLLFGSSKLLKAHK